MTRLTLLLPTALLVACPGSRSPSTSTFELAIQDYYASQAEACIDSGMRFPHERLGSTSETNPRAALLNELVSLGFLHSDAFDKQVRAQPLALFNRDMKTVSGTRYSLTAQGESLARSAPGPADLGTAFCYGSYRVVAATTFTEPADFLGRRVSIATYTYEAIDIARWAANSTILRTHSPRLARDLKSRDEPLNGEATLVLTNTGWKHSALLRE